MRREGPVVDVLALGDALLGAAVVDVGRREHAERGVVVLVIAPVEEVLAVYTRILCRAEALGKVGPVLQRLELRLALNGLSLDTCGRECVLVTPRSAKRNATGFEVIDAPRSAWTVS